MVARDNQHHQPSSTATLSGDTIYNHHSAHSDHSLLDKTSSNHPDPNAFHIDIPHPSMATEIALAALSTLPTPLLVLNSLKTVLLANNAMGKLLGIAQDDPYTTITDLLRGQTLSQIGIDLVSDGVPIWVSWDKFLDNVASGLKHAPEDANTPGESLPGLASDDTTPTATPESRRGRSPLRPKTHKTQDTVVDVIISSRNIANPPVAVKRPQTNMQSKSQNPAVQATCRMIISIWSLHSERYFTLTFTSLPTHSSHKVNLNQTPSSHRTASSNSTKSSQSSQSHTPISSTSNSRVTSPAENANGVTYPSIGNPSQYSAPPTFTDFQKIMKMKNAMLNAIDIPLAAVWRDESVVFPNQAARKLLAVSADPTSDESYDFMSRFTPWSTDFSHELKEEDNPIIALCRTQKPFSCWKVGLIDEKSGKKSTFDISGHPVFDERTAEFLGGLMVFKDVTEYTEKIASQSAENAEQFRLICDSMPQMFWTTRPDGYHDYFSQRWYDYTGLTPGDSLGFGWTLPFHEEDMPETRRRWAHSLATGDEYKIEYRCRRYDGEWRWMLGRALPLRDHKSGRILKWFGSCTDIQEIIDAKLAGHQARQNLLDVLTHSQMSLWIIDREEKVTFFEGGFLDGDPRSGNRVGKSIYDILKNYLDPNCTDEFRNAVSRTLSGTSDLEVCENKVNNRWFRSKFVPLKGNRGMNGVEDEDFIAGVIGIGTEVTQLRQKEQENIKLLANETAAKEASKMKSNFLANMSHEIRTPIAGVLGMSDLLMDTVLDNEQLDFAQNIQRSANSLLTVINDILDFSKIESGRLDIEEVQFSLGILLQDVSKMLSFAAQRKNLNFSSDVHLGTSEDVILLGDPGRIRQILTNLLTNSIKFTSDGYVRMCTEILSETNDTTTIEFMVEDSGIGIEEEVKKRLFTPFSQADSSTARRFGGTGLGLTICKNLVDLMHGSIRLDSKLDAGTKAVFTIPFKRLEYRTNAYNALLEVGNMPDRLQSELSLSMEGSGGQEHRKSNRLSPPLKFPDFLHYKPSLQPSSLPEAVQPVTIPENERSRYHVLVVEDNPVNQQIALKFIKALKFSAAAVWNGKEALEYLLKATSPNLTRDQSKKYPLPSLVLMDVQMPVLDGYHATHLLRHHAPFTTIQAIDRIPIVAMTASAIHGDREKCERAGMDDYMAKPVKRSTLEKTILKWVTNGRPISPSNSPKPPLGRSKTDNSSSCTQHEAMAAEFLAHSSGQENLGEELLSLTQDITTPAAEAFARRSDFSQSLMNTAIPGGESEGDRAIRRAAAEDKARSLRDAKLFHAIEGDRTQPGTVPKITSEDETPSIPVGLKVAVDTSNQSSSNSGLSPTALTEENITRFNLAYENSGDLPLRPGSPGNSSNGLLHPISDIPGPPPEGLLVAVDLVGVDANAEAVVQSLLSTVQHSAIPTDQDTRSERSSPKRSRKDVGGLSTEDRQKSDWSTSTARPEK